MSERYVTVYAEATPNSDSIKFVFNGQLIHNGMSYDYPTPESAKESPLAYKLFQFNFVRGVFISRDFVTITKDSDSLWAELIPILRAFLKEYAQGGEPILSDAEAEDTSGLEISENDPEPVRRIKEILLNNVKPVVEMDGGNIEFRSFEDGVVTLALKGSCAGCPSSTITLKSGIQALLQRLVPEVKEVVAEAA